MRNIYSSFFWDNSFKKIVFFVVAQMFLSCTGFTQSFFVKGFNEGYKKGYCYEKVNCIAPNPPIAPVPKIGESNDNYQDGYSRGFKTGIDESKDIAAKDGYKTSHAETIDYMSRPSDMQQKIASNAERNFNTGINRAQELYEEGKYADCINLCKIISNMTKLVSYKYYKLISMSYEKLGDWKQSERYSKEGQKFLQRNP
ncbi:MAG: hypothetical protein EOO01_06890 [Chitinophagaceae bacterium]|nr:MAG: hypothetical protein EOO01_06890 [Chitinophagaceae bacterium]